MSSPLLRLDWCGVDAARYACENWHYSKTFPSSKTVRVGVWEAGRFIGVVIFSCGSAGVRNVGPSLGLRISSVAELARVALTKHSTPVSRIVAIALRLLAKEQPGLEVIISYADPAQGHIGGIYQAGNWVYAGTSSADSAYVDKAGRVWHSRTVSESGFKIQYGAKKACPKPSEMTKRPLQPKYKYFFPLSERARCAVERLRKPYPKRVASETSDTAAFPAEKGGVTPTATLHPSSAHCPQ